MAIYIRGDAVPFVITRKSVGTNPTLYGYWSDEKPGSDHQTNLSRIVADGGLHEVDAHLATLPCPVHGLQPRAICPEC